MLALGQWKRSLGEKKCIGEILNPIHPSSLTWNQQSSSYWYLPVWCSISYGVFNGSFEVRQGKNCCHIPTSSLSSLLFIAERLHMCLAPWWLPLCSLEWRKQGPWVASLILVHGRHLRLLAAMFSGALLSWRTHLLVCRVSWNLVLVYRTWKPFLLMVSSEWNLMTMASPAE